MAAGLGFKTFTTGEVLTAADTNGYLMQGVLVFASSAARAAAITSPQEGQYSYLKDTNLTQYYDGAAWVSAGGGGGKVLQVVTATYSTSTSNSSATYADTGLSATITPTLNTSKVLVLVYHNGITKSAAVNYQQMSIKLVRAATDILVSSGINYVAVANDASTTFAASILDSPATTSATTYKTTFNSAGVASVTIQAGGSTSTITLLEIGA